MLHRKWVLGTFALAILVLTGLFFFGSWIRDDPAQSPSPGEKYDLSYLRGSNPAEVNNSDLPVTPTDRLHTTGSPPSVDMDHYRLTIDGHVDREVTYTYEELQEYPSVTRVVLLICPQVFVDNAEWTGVPVSTLLAEAGVKDGAHELVFHAVDGYRRSLSLEEALGDGVFLAYNVNGETLPRIHGYPLRLVVTGRYGDTWVKWVERIKVR